MSGGTLLFGPTGSGKTYTAVKDFVLPQLRAKRRVTTNITGLNPGALAIFLGQSEATVRKNLNIIEDERIGLAGGAADDSLWANDANTGWVRHGDLLVLDEAWQWLQYIKQITPAADHFLRRHRKFKGGFPARSTEYVFLTQTSGDLHEKILAMCNRKVGFVKLEGTGRQDIYTRGDYQAGNLRAAPTQTTGRYDPRIFPLYQSYNGEIGAAEEPEQILDQRQVIWKSRSAVIGACMVVGGLLLATTAGRAFFFPKPKGANATVSRAVAPIKGIAARDGGTGATREVEPNEPPPGLFSLPSDATMASPHNVSAGGVGVSGPNTLPSAFAVLPLKGDPASVQRVVDAFCAVSGCKAVVEAGTQQVVLVGTDKAIADARKLIASLGSRPPASLVQLVIFESDDSTRSETGVVLDIGGSWGSLTAGSQSGGITARMTAGQFSAGLSALRGRGLARVVSAPVLAVYPGQQASVTAGLQVPVLSQIVLNAQGQTTTGVEYRNSGVLVNLEQVSAGPRPVMKVSVEVSDFQATEIGVKGNPSKSQRALTTSVEVPPCEAVILGGMTREARTRQNERVPILNLPLNDTSRVQQTRLFVALISRPAAGSAAACAAPEPAVDAPAAPEGRG